MPVRSIVLVKGRNYRNQLKLYLSKKLKTFSQFLVEFLKSTLNFEHFDEKQEPRSSCILEITDCQKRGHLNVLNGPFWSLISQVTC